MTRNDELGLTLVEELQCSLGLFVNRKITSATLRDMAQAVQNTLIKLSNDGWFDNVPKIVIEQSVTDPNVVTINFIDEDELIKPLRHWFWRQLS
jgi:hypothetical protein